jgi:large subunit ribosomal protein L25
MDKIVISAKTRNLFGKKVAGLRTTGQIPAVVYGNSKDNASIELDAKEFGKVFSQVGHSALAELKIDDGAVENVLVHDVSTNPITSEINHVDFYRINMKKTIRTEIPLHFIGESPAVFQQEGSLFKNIEEVEVETLPANLPPHIEVDISVLDDFSKTIHVSDIKVPDGVELLAELDQLICKVDPPRSEEEMAALDEEIGDAIPEGANEEGEEATEGEAKSGDEAKAETESKDKDKE